VTKPGAVFGELSVLLDQPHTADVRALEVLQFHVADAATILRIDPIALLYVATALAQRLDSANRGLLELKRQVQAGEPAQRNWENGREDRRAAPRVPILCMPAILMTRLHPTYRGAERSHRSGRSPDWLKMKNPACAALKREEEEDWGKERWR